MVVVGWLAAGAGVLKVSQVQKFLLSLSLHLSLDSRFQLSKISRAFAYIHACVGSVWDRVIGGLRLGQPT